MSGTTVAPPPYLPFADPHKSRPPGLFPLQPGHWIEPDAAFAPQMALRDRLIADSPAVVTGALPGAETAIDELFAVLADHLCVTHPDLYRRGDSVLHRPDGVTVPLDPGIGTLGRLCQEDWLILQARDGADEYFLTAGNLCFPSHWALADKLGKPLTAVHAPVPGYAAALAPRVNRIFAALHPDRPLQRLNWSLAATDRLNLPAPRGDATGHARFLRVERQTLRRLPRTGAVIFSVKTYISPLGAVPAPALPALRAATEALAEDHASYKGGRDFLRSAVRNA